MRTTSAFLTTVILFTATTAIAGDFQPVLCEGTYPHHLQGVCTDEKEAVFRCFTTKLVKTDRSGKTVKQAEVADHHGGLCHRKVRIFAALNLGKFNARRARAIPGCTSTTPVRSLLTQHKTPEAFHGVGGIAFHEGRFPVVGGLPNDVNENYVLEYDGDFKFVKKHVLAGGQTHLGIQTAAFADGYWWFGCYGTPKSDTAPSTPPILLKADATSEKVERFEFDCPLGIVPVGNGKFRR